MTSDGGLGTTPDVGPVLICGRAADAVVAAIRQRNAGARVKARGSYLRVTAPVRCVVESADVSALLGEPFNMLQDLERIMPSFVGRLQLSEERASWEMPGAKAADDERPA